MRERGAYSPLTHTPHPTPTHPTLNTRIHLSASVLSDVLLLRLEHPPQSSRVPIPFTHTLILASIHPSITLRQGGATGLSKRKKEKREDGRTTTTPFFLSLPLGQPPRRLQPTPSLAGRGEKKGGGVPPLSSPPCLAFVPIAFTPLQAFSQQAAGFSPVSFSSTSHTPSSPDTIGRPPSRGPFAVPL